MANMLDELRSGRTGRRTLLQAGGAAGALLAAGIPAYVLADQGDGQGKGHGKGQGQDNPLKNIAVTGSGTQGTTPVTFTGKLDVTGFFAQGGQVFALGVVKGVATNAAGKVVQEVAGAVTGPVSFPQASTGAAAAAAAPAACPILNLVLGPLTLDLLGLVVVIPLPIVLNVFAVPGAGNLLGNLLCGVAGLLDNLNLNLAGIVNDLNNILIQLGL